MYTFTKTFRTVRIAILAIFFLVIISHTKAQDVLIGLTSNGGPEGRGTVFSIKSTGTNFSIIKGFADWGNSANGDLYRNSDGIFYGMTPKGGTYGYGTIFKMTSAGVVTIIRQLDYDNDGAYPDGELIKGSDGNLYGMTASGGASTAGTIFKITTAGVFTVIRSFNYSPDGAAPHGHLILGTDGNFYGITSSGGVNGYGTIFKMTTAGTYTVLRSFNGTTDGGPSYGSITEGTDGDLYGITYGGGTNGLGTIFKIAKTGGSFSVLRNFSYTTDGAYARGDLIQATDGNFYGFTAAGGTNGIGTIFRITPTGTFTVIRHLSSADGQGPIGNLMQNTDGFLYGMAHGGANGAGTFFKISTAGAFTLLHAFKTDTEGSDPNGSVIRNTDGTLWGLTSYGGPNFGGTAFKITTAGAFTLLSSFNGASLGNAPYESLIRGSDSAFYGTTSDMGVNQYYGTIFKICAGNTTVLHAFNGSQGGIPKGSLVEGTNGILYGTTESGGTNGAGVIFKITKSGTYTVMRNLSGNDGSYPNGSLIQATDGNLYGMNNGGGVNSGGTIFKITIAGAYTVLRAFNSADGYYPYGDLVQGTDGNFYGTTSTGGTNGFGTIFKITPAGAYTVLRNLSANTDGSSPRGSLIQYTDGNFYGTTSAGGTNGAGTIFKISSTGTFQVIKQLNAATTGSIPQGKLLVGSDGNFYGLTSSGGSNNAGTIFKVTSTGILTVLRHLSLTADGGKPFGGLIIAPTNTLVANAQTTSTSEDIKKTITLSGSGGSPLTYNIIISPKHGKVTGNGANKTYTPTANYSGKDSFSFNVTVGCVASELAKVNITVTAVADTPVLAAIGNKSVARNATLTFTATATDPDKNTTLTYSLIGAPAGASINSSTGAFSWTPTTTGNFIFKVRVTDNTGLFDEEQITVTVTASFAASDTNNESIVVQDINASLYPNPTKDKITVITSIQSRKVNVIITEVKGAVITQRVQEVKGKNSFEINVAQLSPGTYFVKLQTLRGYQTLKFTKL